VKRVAVVLIALPLAGCIADQKQQIAACYVKAAQTYPGENLNVLSPSSNQVKMADFVQACMASAGYDFTCQGYPAVSDRYRCYVPNSLVGKWAYSVEKKLFQNQER